MTWVWAGLIVAGIAGLLYLVLRAMGRYLARH